MLADGISESWVKFASIDITEIYSTPAPLNVFSISGILTCWDHLPLSFLRDTKHLQYFGQFQTLSQALDAPVLISSNDLLLVRHPAWERREKSLFKAEAYHIQATA